MIMHIERQAYGDCSVSSIYYWKKSVKMYCAPTIHKMRIVLNSRIGVREIKRWRRHNPCPPQVQNQNSKQTTIKAIRDIDNCNGRKKKSGFGGNRVEL